MARPSPPGTRMETTPRAVFFDVGGTLLVGQDLRVPTDAPAALDSLRKGGFVLGVISNTDETLVALLERKGLAPWFRVVVSSTAARSAKPDARIFRHALSLAGVAPENAWHVGDDLIADGLGAA